MLLLSILATVFGMLQIVPTQAPQDTLSIPALQDTTGGQMPGMVQQEEEEKVIPDTVYVWNYKFPESFKMSETDSTLRWVNLLNLFNKFHSERGAITYRLGTLGRMDGIHLHGFETRHINLEMEGLILNDPLTGNVNWNRLPIHKIGRFYEANYGASYRSRTRLRDYYLIQPRTYLNFDESKFDYRSLEFSFTQNFRKSTNLELSFWDRRDGGGYRRRAVVGRQAVIRGYHQLNHQWLVKFGYINNGMDREEPFGYQISNPALFTFNTFAESANQSNANSNQTSSDLYAQIHHRADTSKNVSSILGLHYQTSKWSLTYNADTLSTNFSKTELFGRQRMSFGDTELYGTARAFWLTEKEKSNVTESNWLGGELSLDATQKISGVVELNGYSAFTRWSDGRTSTELSGRLAIQLLNKIKLSGFGGILSKANDIQTLYWQSDEYSGSEDLKPERSAFIGLQAEIDLLKTLTIGIRGDIRNSQNTVLAVNSAFRNVDDYTFTSGTAWLELNSRIFEGEVSGTYKTYSSDNSEPLSQILAGSGDRIWLKSRFYWKNYLFDRATFVKAGFSGIFSPNPFRTAQFITPLNRWQHGTNEFINPSYYRLDVDVSARIRWFMVLLKWENVLDQIEQLGYFESVGHPMPGRRFRFGIRVLFTN